MWYTINYSILAGIRFEGIFGSYELSLKSTEWGRSEFYSATLLLSRGFCRGEVHF